MSEEPALSNTVRSTCNDHAAGRLDPRDRAHVLHQLRAEGHKRLESFLFEPTLQDAVRRYCGDANTTEGWSFQFDDEQLPRYWFKLTTSEANACDQAMLRLLRSRGCYAAVVRYDETERTFKAKRIDAGRHDYAPLADVLAACTGRSSPTRSPLNYKNIDINRQKETIEAIDRTYDDEMITQLSLSRLLVNCYLYPWFGKQPMDLDVCCLTGDKLRLIEFKRKYPTSKQDFGIDEDPHGKLIDWLGGSQLPLTHVILCDPLWDKNASPLHLLSPDSPTVESAYWLAAELTHENTQGERHSTTGADSGMFDNRREQRPLALDLFRIVGRGLTPQLLGEYLDDPTLTASAGTLRKARDEARNASTR